MQTACQVFYLWNIFRFRIRWTVFWVVFGFNHNTLEFRDFAGGMLLAGGNPWLCFVLATAGNGLGSVTSYGLGYLGKWQWIENGCG